MLVDKSIDKLDNTYYELYKRDSKLYLSIKFLDQYDEINFTRLEKIKVSDNLYEVKFNQGWLDESSYKDDEQDREFVTTFLSKGFTMEEIVLLLYYIKVTNRQQKYRKLVPAYLIDKLEGACV
jgi:penicillin V acylase-like amidase (Ntn superfamily)